MTKKAFAIRVPAESLRDVNHFFTWVTSHLTPGMPNAKVKFSTTYIAELYEKFVADFRKNVDFDYVKALAYSKDLDWTVEKHQAWKREQSVEIHVENTIPGVYQLNCKLFGPGLITDVGMDFGYIDFYSFFVSVYQKGEDYVLNYTPMMSTLPEDVSAVDIFPSLEMNYTISEKTTPKSHLELNAELMKQIAETLSADVEGLQNHAEFLNSFTTAAFEFTGSAYNPLRYEAFMVTLPKETGKVSYVVVNVSYGHAFKCVLPVIRS